ncbi:hypothetical protein ACIPR8_11070 [Stenotrophomonas sp. LARHCG68]
MDADGRIAALVGVVEEQGRQIGQLAAQVGLLVQSVAQLLGEETGIPVEGEGETPERVDLDGRPY